MLILRIRELALNCYNFRERNIHKTRFQMYLVCFQIKKRSGRSAFNWVLQWLLYLSADAAWELTYILRGSSTEHLLINKRRLQITRRDISQIWCHVVERVIIRVITAFYVISSPGQRRKCLPQTFKWRFLKVKGTQMLWNFRKIPVIINESNFQLIVKSNLKLLVFALLRSVTDLENSHNSLVTRVLASCGLLKLLGRRDIMKIW